MSCFSEETYLKRSGYSCLQEAIYMAIVEKQARIMALSKSHPTWLRIAGSSIQLIPTIVLFLFVPSCFIQGSFGDVVLEACFTLIEYYPIVLFIEVFCTLHGYATVSGALKRLFLIGPLSAFGLLYFVKFAIEVEIPNCSFESIDVWLAFYFGLLPCIIGTALLAVFLAYYIVANHDNVLLVGDLFSLVLTPILFLVPYGFTFVMLVIGDVFDLEGSLELDIQIIGMLILVFPATFVLLQHVFMLAFSRIKKRWSEKYFFGNDINQECCFTLPSHAFSHGGMRSYISHQNTKTVAVPARSFCVLVHRPWGVRFRRGSIVRNCYIFFCDKYKNTTQSQM